MEDLKESVRRTYDALSLHTLDALMADVFAEDAELVGPTAGQVKGIQAIADHWKNALETTPDGKATIHRIIREGNVVVVEYTLTGTNTGPLRLPTGEVLPATNKRVTFPAVDIWTFEGGKAVSQHLYFDRFSVLAQLGLMPAPAGATA